MVDKLDHELKYSAAVSGRRNGCIAWVGKGGEQAREGEVFVDCESLYKYRSVKCRGGERTSRSSFDINLIIIRVHERKG